MRILRLPVNEYWYSMIKSGKLTHDYREIKPFWTKRLEGQEYDVVEFYHRFKKNIKPLRYKLDWIKKGRLVNYNMDAYIIKFSDLISGFDEWKGEFDTYLKEMISELKSDYLDEMGFDIEVDEGYKFVGEKSKWLAAYERESDRIFTDNVILIAINYHKIYDEMCKRGIENDSFNIEAQARITIGHEVGHALVDWLALNLDEDEEESLVEEFGESMFPEATDVYHSKLLDILKNNK